MPFPFQRRYNLGHLLPVDTIDTATWAFLGFSGMQDSRIRHPLVAMYQAALSPPFCEVTTSTARGDGKYFYTEKPTLNGP